MSFIENESATFEDLCLRLERDFPGSPAAALLQRFYEWRRYTATLQREADGLREADEAKYDALMQISQWCDAYPQDVFEPLPPDAVKRADKVLADAGISIGALHAGWARHLLQSVGRIARAALSPTQQEQKGSDDD